MPDAPRDRIRGHDSTLAKLRPILDVMRQITAGPELRKIIVQILDLAVETCDAQRGALVVFKNGKARVEIARHRSGVKLHKSERGLSMTVLRSVEKSGRPVRSADLQADPKLKMVDSINHLKLRSLLCVPLKLHDKVIGALYLDDPTRADAFQERDVQLVEILTEHAAIAIENARLYRQSNQDRLTRLWNHAHFRSRLEREMGRAKERGGSCGVLMIDIDDFKHINDDFGHEVGNQVLKHVAKTLTATVRAADLVARVPKPATVARYGGDEFEVVLPGATIEGVSVVGNRLVYALGGRKFSHEGRALRLSISVGGAVYPDHAKNADELLLRADEALYESKRGGKNRAIVHHA